MAVAVEQRGDFLCYRICFDGWKARESTGCKATARNRKKLEAKAAAMSELMAEGRFNYLEWFPTGTQAPRYRPAPPPAPAPVLTVDAYVTDTWLPRMTPPAVRASRTATYTKHLRCHILPAFGAVALGAITRRALLDFRAELTRAVPGGKGLAMKTARDMIDGTFRALYRDARRDGLVAGDPFADLDWPRKVRVKPDPFTEEERDLLLTYFWQRNRHYYPLVYVAFHTGMRTSELVGLRWAAVDLRHRRLLVRVSRTLGEDNAPKTTHSERSLVATPAVVAVLRAMQPLQATAATFVFTTQHGTPLDEERFVEKHWHRALRATGIRPRKFYATRHTFITLGVARGGNLKTLAEYAGTSLQMIEDHYAASSTEAQQASLLALIAGAEPAPGTGRASGGR
jgi:integrase